MSQGKTVPSPQTIGSHKSSTNIAGAMNFAGAIFLAVIMVWFPSPARSQSVMPDSAGHVDASALAAGQLSAMQARAKALEAVQRTMTLGVVGLPETQSSFLKPTLKSLAVRSVEGPKTRSQENAITVWERMVQYRFWPFCAFAVCTMAWLSYHLRSKVVKGLREGLLWFDARALGVRRIVQVDELSRDSVMTPAAVRQRGWSQDLMIDLLGPPDFAVLDPTGLNQPLILISRQRVEALENSAEFRAYREMRARRAREDDLRLTKWNELHGEFLPYPLVAGPETVW